MATTPYPIPRDTRETAELNGNGGKTYGPFDFKIFDIEDVRAYVKAQGAEQWSEASVTVAKQTGAEFDHFTVTFDSALPATTRFRVASKRLHSREIAVTKGGSINATELEKELSKQGSILEELRRDVDQAGEIGVLVQDTRDYKNSAQTAADRSEAAATVSSGLASAFIIAENTFATKTTAEAWRPIYGPDYLRLSGHTVPGIGGALYRRVVSEPIHDGKFSITLSDGITVVWYEIAEAVLTPEMFGAVGDGVVDDTAAFKSALAIGKDVYASSDVYYLTDTLEVMRQTLYGQNGNKTHLLFNHANSDFAIKVWTSERGGGINNITLDAAVDGLKGLNLQGTVIANCHQVFINNFTSVSLQLGNTGLGMGIYWSKISLVRIRLDGNKNGDTGVLIDGGSIPGSNDNSLEDVVIGGNFKRPLHIKGVGNYVKGGTIELSRGDENVESLIFIEGSGNKIDGMYVEPVGTAPEILVEFGSNASGNIVELWPQYVPPHNTHAAIKDNGAHNKVKLRRPGANFRIGPEAEPTDNLLSNSAFRVWRDAENPAGWIFGTIGLISRVAPETPGGPALLRMTVADNNATIQTYITDYHTATTGVMPIDLVRLQGKPMIAGVWCRTDLKGAGGIKLMAGSSVGTDTHSGSGLWELLLAHNQVGADIDRVGVELRSHVLNAPLTGIVDFRSPFLIIGTDVPYFEPKPLIDSGSRMFGDLEFPLDYTDKARGGLLRLGSSYLWTDSTGRLRIGTTRPTHATWDTAGVVVGTQT